VEEKQAPRTIRIKAGKERTEEARTEGERTEDSIMGMAQGSYPTQGSRRRCGQHMRPRKGQGKGAKAVVEGAVGAIVVTVEVRVEVQVLVAVEGCV
jgi:hypothetical protein